MKKSIILLQAMLALGWLATSCTSTEDDSMEAVVPGTGTVTLSVAADAGFSTGSRAVDESAYKDLANYTVQILDDAGKEITGMEWKYADIPEGTIELSNGSYILKAFYGTDKAASTEGMYVEGTKNFTVNSDQKAVAVECAPVCARVKVEFDEKMSTYFSNYSIAFNTLALGQENNDSKAEFNWTKTTTGPLYLKVNQNEKVYATIRLTDKQSKTTEVEKTYTMSPNTAKLIKVVPAVKEGNLGITITIDESTVDHDVDIVIPSEWI